MNWIISHFSFWLYFAIGIGWIVFWLIVAMIADTISRLRSGKKLDPVTVFEDFLLDMAYRGDLAMVLLTGVFWPLSVALCCLLLLFICISESYCRIMSGLFGKKEAEDAKTDEVEGTVE